MNVSFNANAYDSTTERIARLISTPLDEVATAISGDYGGPMDNLWVDVELIPTRADHHPALPFRLQKRVSGRSRIAGITLPDHFNVGHYSVRPDFCRLLSLSDDQVVPYVLDLLLESFDILGKASSIRGFDVAAFKTAFVRESRSVRGANVA